MKSGREGFGEISFSHEENAPSNRANGWFSIDADEYELFLKGSMGLDMSEKKLTAQEAAELMWANLLERAGISDA